MDSLEGKTAVITGAASGMGRAFAERFARAGMKLVLADIETPSLDATVAELTGAGATAIGVRTDVADAESVQQLAERAIETYGRVNVVCNNAGVAGSSLGADPGAIALPEWSWVLQVNLFGVIHGHRSFLPHLLEHGDGHIVNTASMAGHFPGHSAYSASKWAVVGLSEGLYNQLGMLGSSVGVTCLCPGWVDTGIAHSERNRPEWAAPDALAEPSADDEARLAFVRDLVATGRPPAEVADLVHDAVVDKTFWVFTDSTMVASLQGRFDAVLGERNPEIRSPLG